MGIEADISKGLFTTVENAVTDKPIQFPMRTFKPPNDGKYVEIVQIRNNLDNEYYGQSKTHQGTLRVILHWPLDDAGSLVPLNYLESIAPIFAKGTIIRQGNARIVLYDNPDIGSNIITDKDFIIVLSVSYRDFHIV